MDGCIRAGRPGRRTGTRRTRAAVLATLLAAGCGGGAAGPATPPSSPSDAPSASSEPTLSPTPEVTAEDLAAADLVLLTGETERDLELGGYGFRRATISSPGPTIEVDAGRPITVGLRNIHGYLDGESIPHDWAVVARKEEGSEPLWGSQIPFIDPDEAGIVTFTPGEPGRYFYICTLSSHLSGHGMWGRLVVR